MRETGQTLDPLVFGGNADEGLIAVEFEPDARAGDRMALFVRRGDRTVRETEPFRPFLVVDARLAAACPDGAAVEPLEGPGPLNRLVLFRTWKDCVKAKAGLAATSGASPSAPDAPFLFLNDPVHQHLLLSGRTSFLGMRFEQLRRLQVDIECLTTEGFDFCNAGREGDRIVAIGLADHTGWVDALCGARAEEEKALLERFVELVRERDPDVIEGHNVFNFDLPYLAERARRHGVALALGRDGSEPRRRPSRFGVGERTIAYERFDIAGRHVVDTLFLTHAYDVTHRSLAGFGLKEVAVHFGVAAPDRTYIDGARISREFQRSPEKVLRYVRDDVAETRAISGILSASSFIQAQILPYAYQTVSVRGSATKIDALLVREYLRRRRALPLPDRVREFEGGYTDLFVQGIVKNVHHVDVRSLYPSLMLTRRIGPRQDELGVFLRLLEVLRDFRLRARERARAGVSAADRTHFDVLQTTFKILINSFYGYLGFSQAHFNDFAAAEEVTRVGRALLRDMIGWLKARGAAPVEIDTDGIYFVPPTFGRDAGRDAFRRAFADSLPEGIEVEFDGEFRAMFSYKMKNYALLDDAGEVVIRGAALKSRGLEPFQRSFLEDLIRLRLAEREDEIPRLKEACERAIRNREWPIERLAKTETLQDSPATYAAKTGKGARGRNAAYELALRSGREYRAGDRIAYYVTGQRKNVPVHGSAKLVSEWNPGDRDENVAYYLAKLEALYAKFGPGQAELALGLPDKGAPAGEEEE